MMRGAAALTGTGNLVIKYIESLQGTRKGARDVLLDAYNTRSLILVLDGLVRAPLFNNAVFSGEKCHWPTLIRFHNPTPPYPHTG